MSQAARDHEREVINDFLEQLSRILGVSTKVIEYPEDFAASQAPGGTPCEAIVEIDGTLTALEHTTWNTFAGEQEDTFHLDKVYRAVEKAVSEAVPDLFVEVLPRLRTLRSPPKTRQLLVKTLHEECLKAIEALRKRPDFQEEIWDGPKKLVLVSGGSSGTVEIVVRVWPGDGCVMRLLAPATQAMELSVNVLSRLQDKHAKLANYNAAGFKTLLVLDSTDSATISAELVVQVFEQAWPTVPAHVQAPFDDIFLCRSIYRPHPARIFPLKLGASLCGSKGKEFRHFSRTQACHAIELREAACVQRA